MKQKATPGQKIICLNRKANFNYFFIELLEAGISLKGSEVKSLRDGKDINDFYLQGGDVYSWIEQGLDQRCLKNKAISQLTQL